MSRDAAETKGLSILLFKMPLWPSRNDPLGTTGLVRIIVSHLEKTIHDNFFSDHAYGRRQDFFKEVANIFVDQVTCAVFSDRGAAKTRFELTRQRRVWGGVFPRIYLKNCAMGLMRFGVCLACHFTFE